MPEPKNILEYDDMPKGLPPERKLYDG
ncbi:uncharacterized protein METZ01_LOCUS457247 [marine metagenome]|uniref:Uncharacterized protein n=1 Tax=marine metagenome TaxID=408172 RepID=A0A383A9U0_9ZZZZ